MTSRQASILPILAVISSASLIASPILHGAGLDLGELAFWRDMILGLGFYGLLPWSLFRVARGRSVGRWRRYGPIAVQTLALAAVWLVDVERLVTQWNFRARMADRLEVVELVRRGSLAKEEDGPCECFYARLPARYAHVSSTGRVSVAQHSEGFSVTFFVKRAWMFPEDDYTAFIFRSGAGEPQTHVEDTYHFISVQRWAEHWFFVWHT